MKQIQHWFDRLVGVAAEEARLRRMAHAVFDVAEDFAALETPACWRRARRVGHLGQPAWAVPGGRIPGRK